MSHLIIERRNQPGFLVPGLDATNSSTNLTVTSQNPLRGTRFVPQSTATINYLGTTVSTAGSPYANYHIGIYSVTNSSTMTRVCCTNSGDTTLGRTGWLQEDLSTASAASSIAGTISGTGNPYTITGMSSTAHFYVGAPITSTSTGGATVGTGATVASIVSGTSITFNSTSGTVTGTLSGVSITGTAGTLAVTGNIFKATDTPATLIAGQTYWAIHGAYTGSAWSSASAYTAGQYAYYATNSTTYYCLQTHSATATTPDNNSGVWSAVTAYPTVTAHLVANNALNRIFATSGAGSVNGFLYHDALNGSTSAPTNFFDISPSSGLPTSVIFKSTITSLQGSTGVTVVRPTTCLRTS